MFLNISRIILLPNKCSLLSQSRKNIVAETFYVMFPKQCFLVFWDLDRKQQGIYAY